MRRTDAARLGLGLLALARPELPVHLTRSPDGTGVRRTVRVLGARYVAQSVGGSWLHPRWLPQAGAAVDLVHAASMVAVAGIAPHYRRLALLSAGLATTLAVADLVELTDRRNP